MTVAKPSGTGKGDFETLLGPILEPAYRTAYHLTRNPDDAQELLQDAALLAFRGFRNFKADTNFKAWFLTILRNRFISLYRKRKRTVETVGLEDAPDLYQYVGAGDEQDAATANPTQDVIARLDSEQVANALTQLPEEFRDVATLYFTQDLAYQEISNVLGVPIGTVRSRLHRGRKLLQAQLQHLAEEYGIVPKTEAPE